MSTLEPPSNGPSPSGEGQGEPTPGMVALQSSSGSTPSLKGGPDITAAPQTWLRVFLTTATTVFLAELGDKTQLAALLLSAQSGRPAVVFVGASLALICSSLVGVVLGRWLSKLMAPEQLERAAGILMVVLGLWLGRQAMVHLAATHLQAGPSLG